MRGFTRQGWEGMDKVKARYKLQAEFAKEEMYNSKTGQVGNIPHRPIINVKSSPFKVYPRLLTVHRD